MTNGAGGQANVRSASGDTVGDVNVGSLGAEAAEVAEARLMRQRYQQASFSEALNA